MDLQFLLAIASGALANLISWLVERRVDGGRRALSTGSRDVQHEVLPSTGGMWIGDVQQHGDSNVISGPGSRIHIDRRQQSPQRGEKSDDDEMGNLIVLAAVGFVVLAVTLVLVSTYLTAITYAVIGAVVGLVLRAAVLTVRHRRHLRLMSTVGHLATIGLGCAAVVVGVLLVHSADRGGVTLRSYSRLFADGGSAGDLGGYITRSVEMWSTIESSVRPHLTFQLSGLVCCVLLVALTWTHHVRFAHQLRGGPRTGKPAASTVGLVVVATVALTMSSGAVYDVYAARSSSLVPVAGTP